MFAFLRNQVFDKDKNILRIVGKAFWNSLCDDIITHVLTPAIPSDTIQLASYQRTMSAHTTLFEAEMSELGYTEACESRHHNPLTAFVKNIDNHFAMKKKRKILRKARQLIMNQEYNTTMCTVTTNNLFPNTEVNTRRDDTQQQKKAARTIGRGKMIRSDVTNNKRGSISAVNSESEMVMFSMPSCQISASAVGIAKLAYKTLQEAKRLVSSAPQWYRLPFYLLMD